MKQNHAAPSLKDAMYDTKKEWVEKSGHKDTRKTINTTIPKTVAKIK